MEKQNLFSTPEFQNLHPVKQQIIKEVVRSSESSSVEVMLPRMMSINKELSKRNLSFTPEESNLLIRILTEDMSPAERQRVDMVMNLMKN